MLRGADLWLPGYLASLRRRPASGRVRHLLVAVCDHFEPFRGGAAAAAARAAVDAWHERYPVLADGFRDADGRVPRHTFFYPAEEYDPYCLDRLADLTARGYGEVEIHLHHRHDTPDGLAAALRAFRDRLHGEHGLLGERCAPRNGAPATAFGFIHGNWALCNSRPDGDWCGVNEELGVLAAAGCYADFTFPSAPSPTQPRMVNAIYRATDRPEGRGADRGHPLTVAGPLPAAGANATGAPAARSGCGRGERDAGLVLIQGPLGLNWRRRKWGLAPRLETAELSGANPPTEDRLALWTATGVHVRGRPEWVVIKLHTHGCVPANAAVLLGEPMAGLHRALARPGRALAPAVHYVTARELFNIVCAAEDGCAGDPSAYRDYAIAPPAAGRTA